VNRPSAIGHFAQGGQVVPLQTRKLVEVIAIVLLPVAIGMVVAARRPGFAARMEKPTKIFSAAVLAVVTVFAIANEWKTLTGTFAEIGLPVLLFNLLSLLAGYYLSRAAGLDKPLATHRLRDRHPQLHARHLRRGERARQLRARAAGRDLLGGDVRHGTAVRLAAAAAPGARGRACAMMRAWN
jgi:hypothetical protein